MSGLTFSFEFRGSAESCTRTIVDPRRRSAYKRIKMQNKRSLVFLIFKHVSKNAFVLINIILRYSNSIRYTFK